MNEKKFDGMGSIYDQYRPSYPQEFIEYLYSDTGMSVNSIIADIGSGTGILTRQLLEKGSRVYAVEPNNDMRAVAEVELSKYDRFESVDGSAENTTLMNQSIGFVTVAQAFHWFDRQLFKAECSRILKPDGKVVLVWNSRDETSELVRNNEVVLKKYCQNFKGYSGGTRGPENDDDLKDFFAGHYEIKILRNDLTFDKQGFVGRNLSGSYALKNGDKNYQAYVNELTEIFYRFSRNGVLVMPNLTKSYMGWV